MAMWGRMPLPPIPICPQEPWEAQEEAHRDRSRVKFSFCERPGVETRQRESPESRDGAERLTPGPRTPDPRPELPSSEIWARHIFFRTKANFPSANLHPAIWALGPSPHTRARSPLPHQSAKGKGARSVSARLKDSSLMVRLRRGKAICRLAQLARFLIRSTMRAVATHLQCAVSTRHRVPGLALV